MKIEITFDPEQEAALESLRSQYAETSGTQPDANEYLKTVILGIVGGEVARRFDETANAIVGAAKSLPFAERSALVSELRNRLSDS